MIVIAVLFYNQDEIVVHADFRIQPEELGKIKTEQFGFKETPALFHRPLLRRFEKQNPPDKDQRQQRRDSRRRLSLPQPRFRRQGKEQRQGLHKDNARKERDHYNGPAVQGDVGGTGDAEHQQQQNRVSYHKGPQGFAGADREPAC